MPRMWHPQAAIVPVVIYPEHIQQRISTIPGAAPPQLEPGELAVNLPDSVIYIGKGGGAPPVRIGNAPGGPIDWDAGVYF